MTWTFLYDGESRLTTACKAASCSGSGFDRFDFTHDGAGHRTQIKETAAGGGVTTTDFRYDGDKVVQEVVSTGVSRTFTVDEAGTIVKVAVTGDTSANNGTYIVTWNGHGDALALSKIDGVTGALTLANTFTYTTWGAATVTTHNGIGDLRFRYLYVGRDDVQWDNLPFSLGLYYMHARHYSPALGRFLQPDPAETADSAYGEMADNAYSYSANSPVSRSDPTGLLSPPPGIPPGVLGTLFEGYAAKLLVQSGWRIIAPLTRLLVPRGAEPGNKERSSANQLLRIPCAGLPFRSSDCRHRV